LNWVHIIVIDAGAAFSKGSGVLLFVIILAFNNNKSWQFSWSFDNRKMGMEFEGKAAADMRPLFWYV
jgi:hypothetical protein